MSISAPAARAQDNLNFVDVFNQVIDMARSGFDIIWPGELDPEAFSFRGGLATGMMPDYIGSDNYRLRTLPIIDLRYKDIWRLQGTKVTVNAVRKGNWTAGPMVNLNFGREEKENEALKGLGDINTTLEVGGFVQYKNNHTQVIADYRKALGAGQGSNIRLTIGQGLMKKGDFSLAAAARLKWMSDKAMQTNFGVTPLQAERSGFKFQPFEAHSSLSELSTAVIGDYRIYKNMHLAGLVQFSYLRGDAGKSPIVDDGVGNNIQVIGGIGILFQF